MRRPARLKAVLFGGAVLLGGSLLFRQTAHAQRAPTPARRGPPPPAEQAAPIDLSGYWVSIVTEDWRWRMLTPPKGDYASVPLSSAGRKIAAEFNPALYGGADYEVSQIIDCRAYGAAGLMRMPTRVHITWENPNELKLQTDWGERTRRLYFDRASLPSGAPTLQGISLATWLYPPQAVTNIGDFSDRLGKQRTPNEGKLKVTTDHLAQGWLRRNGVPYSDRTVMTEYFQTFIDPVGRRWFDVTTEVVDPEYLTAPFITSSDFRRESDASKWSLHPCKQ